MSGKGSRRRGDSREERKRFEEGWDRIFGRQVPHEPATALPVRPRRKKGSP
jgi:hypothetical protein